MKVSIVIALKGDNPYIRETLTCLRELDYADYEVFLLPDAPFSAGPDVHVIPTGPVGPAAKRDAALQSVTGEIVAFLDDDTYPERDWLRNAVKYFGNPEVAAIGGPAVTPPADDERRQASGAVYVSLLGGGNYAYRYVPREMKEVDDYPTCNLLVRRTVLERLGGFDTTFWPGEDTKLCLEITRTLGMKIIYAPDVVVYHHRRALFSGHLKQVRSYSQHRGYFVKRFPETSLRPSYFLPTLLVVGLVVGAFASVIFPSIAPIYLGGVLVYLTAAVVSAALATKGWRLTILVAFGIITTHIVYGIWFVLGLLSPRLSEEQTAD
ncbi:MAG: glycosyltransferase [Chloroflexi bacterium]|nr:glycosyltransferase [Chloroflexota bacterium]